MSRKKNYSEKEIKQLLDKIKPEKDFDSEVRLKKLENDVRVIFLAISQLKTEIDKTDLKLGENKNEPKQSLKAEKFRKYSISEASNLIREFVSKNPGCRTSEIISNLKIDPDIALQGLQKLKEEKVLRSEEIDKNE